MKKLISFALALAILLSLCSCGNKPQKQGEDAPEIKKEETLPGDIIPDMPYTPTESGEISDYVRLTDGVTFDMLNADFWIDRYAQEETVVMSEKEIMDFNTENSKLIAWDGVNIALWNFPKSASGASVKSYVDTAMPSNPTDYYIEGEPATKEYFDAIDENRNISAIKNSNPVRFGYSVKRAELRSYPTDDFGVTDKEDYVYDKLLTSECMPYLPVVIIHESKDQNWYYVLFYGFGGWVRADAIAICETKEDWLARMNVNDFLVVTGREIRLPHDEGCDGVSELLLPMSTKLPLVRLEDAPEKLRMRIGYGCYAVKLPTRGENGIIKDEYTFVSTKEDVSIGYMQYTHQNVLRLAFKLLGDRYGWGGSAYSNDCSGTLRAVYGCFGFVMPRTAAQQAVQKGLVKADISEKSSEDKIKEFQKLPIGSMVFFPGHIMLYLGMIDDEPFVISSVGSFATLNHPDGEYDEVNTYCINSLTQTKRKNGLTWLENLTVLAYPGKVK